MSERRFEPGAMVEVVGHPPRVPSVLRDGTWQVKVEAKWRIVKPVWRPALYAGRLYAGVHEFLWTDTRHFTRVHELNFETCVRAPRDGTQTQERHIRERGELC